MPRSRPAAKPLSYPASTGQHYVTRGGRRVYLGADRDEALAPYHHLALGLEREVLARHNAAPRPFVWTADLKDILPRIMRAQAALDTIKNQ